MREELNIQADQIEMVLASHRIPSRVIGGTVTPRTVRFRLAMRMDTRLAQLRGLSEEIALSLDAPDCRVVRDNGALSIEIPRTEPSKVSVIDLCRRLASAPSFSPILGLDDHGTPLMLNLASPDVAHVLISGTTGSGKTALAVAMALSLAKLNPQRMLQLVLVDPKGRGFGCLSGLPHLMWPLATRLSEVMARFEWLVSEVERRDQSRSSQPRLVVFVDELADLLMMGGKEMEFKLSRLMQRGREAGVSLIACTQKPTAAVIGSLVKANFPARIVGSVTSADEARVASGISGSGAERLQGSGDFVLVSKGRVTHFAAGYVSGEEACREVARMQFRTLSPVSPPSAGGIVLHRVR